MKKKRSVESAKEAHAYTPGLKVKKASKVYKTRLLPIPGEILVKENDIINYDTIVARASVPGNPTIIKAYQVLNVTPENLPAFMLKKEGDKVDQGELIAKYTPFWGLIKRFVESPVKGTIESISDETGQVIVREPPVPVEINAYIPGKVVEILPKRGVIIETDAAFIQGIFGIGGERHGKLTLVSDSPEDVLTEKEILKDHEGKILVGGSLVTLEALKKSTELNVKGIIAGSIEGMDLSKYLGYEIGVAITGQEDINLTLIITEGFGKMQMSTSVFKLLKEFDGYNVAINGATQIRAGVLRPEIIVPYEVDALDIGEEQLEGGMKPGTLVRIIREPYFGKIGTVMSLPVQLENIDSGSSVRVVEIQLEEGNVVVPRANVEIIEE